MKPKSITLDDIAKRLNVSRVTVSKALRGHPDISTKTADLVKNLAKDLGYTPNYMARNLSSKKSNTIGLVVPKIAHFFFGSLIESIYDTAFKYNYEIILTVSQENAEREMKHLQTLLSMRVDGIIISISEHTHDVEIFNSVKKMGIPLVFVDRVLEIPGFSSVAVDDRGGAFKAVEHAIKIGYKRIGHLSGFKGINIGDKRRQGFEDALKQYNIPLNPNWIVEGGFGEEDGYNGFMHMYKSGTLPDFIFAVTYPVALGAYAAIEDLGLEIPKDIDLICFGNSDINRFISPSLSCVDQPTDKLGRRAVEMVVEHINNPNIEEQHIEIETDLILRETGMSKFSQKDPSEIHI